MMTNTAAAIGAGACGICHDYVGNKSLDDLLVKLLSPIGLTEVIPEMLMDAFGAQSGCGIAFVGV